MQGRTHRKSMFPVTEIELAIERDESFYALSLLILDFSINNLISGLGLEISFPISNGLNP